MTFLEQLTDSIGIVLNSIEATMQTEGLLKQSQQLAGELQTQQKELQQTNEQRHVYDSTTPETQAGAELTGPQILISSPGKSVQNLKSLLKDRCRIMYLPLPSIEEMHIIRDNFFSNQDDSANYLPKTKMLDTS